MTSTLGRLVRGSTAAAVLVTVLVGVPLGLWHYVGWPLPRELPDWEGLLSSHLMSASFLLNVLACGCWVAWAAFVLEVGYRTVEIARGVRWPDLAAFRSPATVLVGTILLAVLGNRTAGAADDPHSSSAPTAVVEMVREPDPQTGRHDSMWAVAERALGDGARWPEVFELNRGKLQPDGNPLTNPHRVFPGEALVVARTAPSPPPSPPPPSPPPSVPSPVEEPDPRQGQPHSGEEASSGTTALVSLSLAAAVATALVVARRRHRGRYRPGSGRRTDLPVSPVVYELKLAHEQAQPEERPVPEGVPAPLGLKNCKEIALDLAASGGLGLVGPGALAAARALLLTALTRSSVAITRDDLAHLLDGQPLGEPPAALRVADNVSDLAAEVVVARAHEQLEASTTSVILLGKSKHGITLYVTSDGVVSTSSPGAGEHLNGIRMFHLGDKDTRELLALFRATERRPEPAAMSEDLELTAGLLSSPIAPLRLTLLGAPAVHWPDCEHDVTSDFQPRMRELIAFLAAHPDGTTRDALVTALWPANTADKTNNALNTALSRLRSAITNATSGAITDIVLAGGGRYRLNPDLVDVDYWHLDRAISARRTATTAQDRIDAYREVVHAYTGPLADGIDSEWAEPIREAVRRDVIDAAAALAQALRDVDPEQTLELLELARAFDPHNELLYRDIMRLQGRLGRLEAIPRTLALLKSKLAEIDDQPSPEAAWLADNLPRHHNPNQRSAS